jgi:hypothetical protein
MLWASASLASFRGEDSQTATLLASAFLASSDDRELEKARPLAQLASEWLFFAVVAFAARVSV